MLKEKWELSKEHLKQLLARCRKVVICLDGWSKKGLTSHYLGISACFYDPTSAVVRHIILRLAMISLPHTGVKIATELNNCLTDWELGAEKVMMIVSDNGANMIRAIDLMKVMNNDDEDECSSSETDSEHEDDDEDDDQDEVTESDSETNDIMELPEEVRYRRMPCMAHTIQLVIKKVYVQHYAHVLQKCKVLVKKLRKSSDAVQQLLAKCGKTVVTDNSTRWNSSYYMALRLLEMKACVNEVLSNMKVDSLTVAEWSKLEEMKNLLEPFATHTDLLQTDALSLSYVVPSILDLDCHLQQFTSAKLLTTAMRADIQHRFSALLEPSAHNFNPLPAAACFLDPSVGNLLLTTHMRPLLDAVKLFIIAEVSKTSCNFMLQKNKLKVIEKYEVKLQCYF